MTKRPLILAVETSGRIGSVALALGEQMLAETAFSAPMKHSAEIFPAAGGLLKQFGRKPQEIEHIYISVGPGSFTGLRIAVTLAKIMHLANAVKIVAVDTLDVIAANVIELVTENPAQKPPAINCDKIAVILDAKRGQFFTAVYQHTNNRTWKKIMPDSLMTASQFMEKFADKDQPIRLLGEGLVYYKDKFKADGVGFLDEKYWTPKAEKVHLLGWKMALAGEFTEPVELRPNYLRSVDAKVKQVN